MNGVDCIDQRHKTSPAQPKEKRVIVFIFSSVFCAAQHISFVGMKALILGDRIHCLGELSRWVALMLSRPLLKRSYNGNVRCVAREVHILLRSGEK